MRSEREAEWWGPARYLGSAVIVGPRPTLDLWLEHIISFKAKPFERYMAARRPRIEDIYRKSHPRILNTVEPHKLSRP